MSRVSANLAADGGAGTLTDIAVAYTTDDPGITASDTITIADGDAVADLAQVAEKLAAKINAINTLLQNAGIAQ